MATRSRHASFSSISFNILLFLFLGEIITISEATSGFFDVSSDLSQQFYALNEAGATADPLSFTHNQLPQPVRSRLETNGLRFEQINPLLQRAVLWDQGYVIGPSGNQFVRIYTQNGSSMADIAVSVDEFDQSGCTHSNCTDANGVLNYRSRYCNGDQILSVSHCASEDVDGEDMGLSMWATGEDPNAISSSNIIPNPNVVRHEWYENTTNSTYLVFGIHFASPSKQPRWDECEVADGEYTAAVVVPCGVYDVDNASYYGWQDPTPSLLVDAWLQAAAATMDEGDKASSFNLLYLIPIIGGAVMIAAILLGLRRYRNLRRQKHWDAVFDG